MRVSFVLRLDPEALADGRFAGEVEAVASGALAALRSVDDLAAFCAGHVDGHGGGRTGATPLGVPDAVADGRLGAAGRRQEGPRR